MAKLKIDSEVSERLQEFLISDLFSVRSYVAKSDYWREHSDRLQTNIKGDSVEITGESGFYVPEKASILWRTVQKILRGLKEPKKVIRWITRQVTSRFKSPRLMSIEKAFNAVMSHDKISDPDLSAYRINHLKLALHPKVFPSVASVRQHY